MPWEKAVLAAHDCTTPNPGRRGVGSIWRCRRCGQRWRITERRMAGYRLHTRWTPIDKSEDS